MTATKDEWPSKACACTHTQAHKHTLIQGPKLVTPAIWWGRTLTPPWRHNISTHQLSKPRGWSDLGGHSCIAWWNLSMQPRSATLYSWLRCVSECCVLSRVRLSVTHELYSSPGSSVHGIIQTRILEGVAISFSRVSSWPRDWSPIWQSDSLPLSHLRSPSLAAGTSVQLNCHADFCPMLVCLKLSAIGSLYGVFQRPPCEEPVLGKSALTFQ